VDSNQCCLRERTHRLSSEAMIQKRAVSKGGRATRPPLQLHTIDVGESPSFTVTQDKCGRVAHTPIAVNRLNKPSLHFSIACP